MKADILWLVGVVILHYLGMNAAGLMLSSEAVILDYGLLALWFVCLAAVDLVCVTLLLGAIGGKFLAIVMYFSCAWSVVLALEAVLNSDFLLQFDRHAQLTLFVAILASLAWGVVKCRESRSPLSSSRS